MVIASQPKAVKLVQAICVLHNYLRTVEDENYTPPGFVDLPGENGNINEGLWRTNNGNNMHSDARVSRSVNPDAIRTRENFVRYFNSSGTVAWQLELLNRRE